MWGTSAKCVSADAACRKSSIMSFADRVRSRLTELIVASDIQNRSQLLTEIKSEQLTIPSTDTSGIELDASVVTHLCRSLTRMLQQPLTVQLDQSLVMDIGRVIFVALPAAHSTRVCEDSDFTPCGTAIQLLAAALFRTYDRKVIGFLLRYLLLNNTPQTVQMATDVWCLICRTSQFLLFGCAGPLIQMEAEFPSGRDARRANLQRIISHLIQFMRTPNTPDSNLISNKYNVPGYHMSDEERQKALTDLTKHILSFEDSFLLHEKTDLIHLYQTIHDPDSDLVAALTAVLKKEKPETGNSMATAGSFLTIRLSPQRSRQQQRRRSTAMPVTQKQK